MRAKKEEKIALNCKYNIVEVYTLILRERSIYGGYNTFYCFKIILSWIVNYVKCGF